MRILFMGTPDFAACSLAALYELDFAEIVGVFTQPDKPVGRKQILEKPPVKLLAEEHGTPVFQPAKMRDGTAMSIIRELDPELIVVVAYGRILPEDILAWPKYGAVNIHGSLLPKYRGAAPIQWAVINGEERTGVTAMYMTKELDAGDIIAIRGTDILPGETAGELFERLAPMGAALLCDTVRSIKDGTAASTPQNNEMATFAPPLTKELAEIDWTKGQRAVLCKIRGMDPWPIASCDVGGLKMKIYRAEPWEASGRPAGTMEQVRKGLRVSCGDGDVLITELQAPGGKRMSAADYLRGHPLCR
ncbi:MAG: methionyl-tRNA formyltransferase [Oscillospiraceae bacterium]|nr:methionyl-tRNA formyltransferase [Oscillospiraceae bacterium]